MFKPKQNSIPVTDTINLAIFRGRYPHEKLDETLAGKNIAVVRYPLIRFNKVRKNEAKLREHLNLQLQKSKSTTSLSAHTGWIFTSQQAVYRFMEVVNKWADKQIHKNISFFIQDRKKFIRHFFSQVKIFSVGNSTGELLMKFGLKVDLSVDENQSPSIKSNLGKSGKSLKLSVNTNNIAVGQRAVFDMLKKSTGYKLAEVIHPCANKIDNYLVNNFKAIGIVYKKLPLYETKTVRPSVSALKKLLQADYWFISSPSIAKTLENAFNKVKPLIATRTSKQHKLPQILVIGNTSLSALKSGNTKKTNPLYSEFVEKARLLVGDFSEEIVKRIIKTIKLPKLN